MCDPLTPVIMDKGQSLIIPPLFDGTNYAYWKVCRRAFLQSFGLSRSKLPYPLLSWFMGFPSTLYPLNSLLWAPLAHSCLLSISYNARGFTTSFLWALLGPLAFFEAHLLFSWSMIHYSCHSDLMVFFSIYLLFSSHIVGFLPTIGPLYQSGHQHSTPWAYEVLLRFICKQKRLFFFFVFLLLFFFFVGFFK